MSEEAAKAIGSGLAWLGFWLAVAAYFYSMVALATAGCKP